MKHEFTLTTDHFSPEQALLHISNSIALPNITFLLLRIYHISLTFCSQTLL